MKGDGITPLHPTIGAALADQARIRGDATALVFGSRRQSFRDLHERADRIARIFAGLGYGANDFIAIMGRNSDRYVELLFGVARAGAAALVVNWRLARPELELIAGETRPRALFFDADFIEEARNLRRRHPGMLIVCIDDETTGEIGYARFLEKEAAAQLPEVDPRSPVFALFTSGTTGSPKGVLISHYNVIHNQTLPCHTTPPAAPRPDDVLLLSPPLFHVGALDIIVAAVMFGAQTVILPEAKVPDIIRAIEEHRISRAVVIPSLMPQLLEASEQGADLSSLRTVLYGMSPIPEAVLTRALRIWNCRFVQNYGLTEASGGVTQLGPDDHRPGNPRIVSCGRPLPDMEVMLRRPDGTEAAPGEPGELLFRSPSTAMGYYRQGRIEPVVDGDGWCETGDIAYRDEDGYIFLCDRKKDMIVSGGENIYSVEVEAVLSLHPAVERVAVIGVPSDKWGEEVKAVILPAPGAAADARAIIDWAGQRLARYKLPKSIDFVTELPLTSVGKIAKNVLRERYWQGKTRRIN